jgi:hypothetical protein
MKHSYGVGHLQWQPCASYLSSWCAFSFGIAPLCDATAPHSCTELVALPFCRFVGDLFGAWRMEIVPTRTHQARDSHDWRSMPWVLNFVARNGLITLPTTSCAPRGLQLYLAATMISKSRVRATLAARACLHPKHTCSGMRRIVLHQVPRSKTTQVGRHGRASMEDQARRMWMVRGGRTVAEAMRTVF